MVQDWLSRARLAEICRTHLFAIVLALLVGIIYAAPNIYHAHTAGYQGIVMADVSDEDFYLSIINKSYESPGLVADAFQYEYRDAPNPLQYFYMEFVLGKIGAALHLSIGGLLQVMEFFFPFLLTLALYAFALSLSKSRAAAYLVSATMILGNEIVHPNGVANLLHTFLLRGDFSEFLTYSRPISPQVNSIFFFIMLGCLLYLFRNPRSKVAVVASGVGLGLMAYTYLYFWAFLCTFLGVMFFYALVMRRWAFALSAAISGVLSLACIVPFLLQNLPVILHTTGSTLTQAIPTHKIIVEKMILVPLFLYVLIYLWGWWSGGRGWVGEWALSFMKKYTFVLLLLITGVIVSNQQVLTGALLYQEHFHFFTNIPIFLLAMSLLGFELMALVRLPEIWRILAIGAVVAVLAWFTSGVQISSYKTNSAGALRDQALAPIFTYLRAQGPDAVLLSDWYLSTRLTIYTQDFSYGTGGLDATFEVPRQRIIHDYFVILALRGVTAGNVREYMYESSHRKELGGAIFIGTYWRDLCGSYSCFPDSVIEDLVPQYRRFIAEPLAQRIHAYKIDYVLWDRASNPDWQIKEITAGKPLVESGDFALYAVR
jgi:hypothetical protein